MRLQESEARSSAEADVVVVIIVSALVPGLVSRCCPTPPATA